MKKPIQILIALAAFIAAGLISQAQQTPKVAVVDMIELFNDHFKTHAQKAKLESDQEKAKAEMQQLLKERDTLVDEYKGLVEQTKNPTATEEATAKARDDAQAKMQEIQKKVGEMQSFEANTNKMLQQKFQNFKVLMFDEIGRVVAEVAKRKGATLVLDKAGPSFLGIPSVIYVDPEMDITKAVQAEIDKSKPAEDETKTKTDPNKITVPIGN